MGSDVNNFFGNTDCCGHFALQQPESEPHRPDVLPIVD